MLRDIDRKKVHMLGRPETTGTYIKHFVHQYWTDTVLGLNIQVVYNADGAFIEKWTLSNAFGESIEGDNVMPLIECLTSLVKKYDLLTVEKESEKCIMENRVLIYCNDIDSLYYFINPFVEDYIKGFYCVYEMFDIRNIEHWTNKCTTAEEMAKYGQELFDYFVKAKNVYLTPNAASRAQLRHHDDGTVANLWPDSFIGYQQLMQYLKGGLVYVCLPEHTFTENMLYIDLNSAYIAGLLLEQHCMSEKVQLDAYDWKALSSEDSDYITFGLYEINYDCTTTICKIYGLEKGFDNTAKVLLTSVDMQSLELVHGLTIKSVKCLSLEGYKKGYLPKYVQELIVEKYIIKSTYAKDDPMRGMSKVILNGLYGSCIKKLTRDDYNKKNMDKKLAVKVSGLCPQWGIVCTAYVKKYILSLGIPSTHHYYSDTDSLIIKDLPYYRDKIAAFNNIMFNKAKYVSETFDIDLNVIKELGSFEIEAEIKKFKANKCKQYGYIDKYGYSTLKISGMNYATTTTTADDFFAGKPIDFGSRSYMLPCKNVICKTEINGKKYISPYGCLYKKTYDKLTPNRLAFEAKCLKNK